MDVLGGGREGEATGVYEASGARFRISRNSENVTQQTVTFTFIFSLLFSVQQCNVGCVRGAGVVISSRPQARGVCTNY